MSEYSDPQFLKREDTVLETLKHVAGEKFLYRHVKLVKSLTDKASLHENLADIVMLFNSESAHDRLKVNNATVILVDQEGLDKLKVDLEKVQKNVKDHAGMIEFYADPADEDYLTFGNFGTFTQESYLMYTFENEKKKGGTKWYNPFATPNTDVVPICFGKNKKTDNIEVNHFGEINVGELKDDYKKNKSGKIIDNGAGGKSIDIHNGDTLGKIFTAIDDLKDEVRKLSASLSASQGRNPKYHSKSPRSQNESIWV